MKFATTLFACITLSLVLVSENVSAGNRFSGKSSGRSSNRSSSRSFNNRNNYHSSRNSNYRNYGQRSTFSQRNSSMKRVSSKQNYRTQQTQKFTNRYNSQKNFKNTKFNTTKQSGSSRTNTYKFSPTRKQTTSSRTQKFNGKHHFNQQHKPTQRSFKSNFKPVKHNNHHGHFNNHHKGHHFNHKGHHGHKHWNRPWCHINYRPVCPSVCRPWYPVVCADPIVNPCVITSCVPVTYNEFNEPLVVAPVIAEEEIVAATQEQAEPERLELVAGQKFQLSAEGLGTEQGMVVLEINEMGLPAKIEKWEDTALGFQTPQIGLSKSTEAKMHIMNKKGQLLATLDINLLPETTAGTAQVAAN